MNTDHSFSSLSDFEGARPAPESTIFVNRNLRMDNIKIIGFDMDYTLARYHQRAIEDLAYRLTIEKLLAMGYPASIQDFKYDPDFVIRGLTVDKKLGNIIKLDRHNHVGRAFHGKVPLTKEERKKHYRKTRLQFAEPRFLSVDTYFSLPEICLFADLVHYFEVRGDRSRDPWQLYEDTRECIDEVHRDDSLKSVIKADLPTYVDKDDFLAKTLHKLRSAGKKLFVLTNSHWEYTNKVMTYLLGDEMPEYSAWQQYFDYMVVGAAKPGFWISDEPFTHLNEEGHPQERDVQKLEKGVVYLGGNVDTFEKGIGYFGDQILYVGDHIYGDILRSKREAKWRTALVIEELETEMLQSQSHREDLERLHSLRQQRRSLDDLCNVQRKTLGLIEKDEAQGPDSETWTALRNQRDENKKRLKKVVIEHDELQANIDRQFNPYWGMVFKEAQENSRFGQQVQRYACLYTSRLSNFRHYSSFQYFRSPRDLLPHESNPV